MATTVLVSGYSAGDLVKITGGVPASDSSDRNTSCPSGYKIWSPRNKQDWTAVYNAMDKKLNNYPRKPALIVDISRDKDGCDRCADLPMNSLVPEQRAWRTIDGSPWWLRDTAYTPPTGSYFANYYLTVTKVDPDDVRFNIVKKQENWGSTDYFCQKISLEFPVTPPENNQENNRTNTTTELAGAYLREYGCVSG